MKNRVLIDPVIKYFVVIIGLIMVGTVLKELQNIFLPFIIAYFFYFLFAPLNKILKKWKVPRFAIITLNIFIVLFVSYSSSRYLVEELLVFTGNIDIYLNKLNTIVRDAVIYFELDDPELQFFSIQKIISGIDYKQFAGGLFTSSIDAMGSIIFVLFFFIFIEMGHQGIYNAFKRRYVAGKQKSKSEYTILSEKESVESVANPKLPTIQRDKIEHTFTVIPEQIQKYVGTKLVLNLLAGITTWIVCLIMGIDFAEIWGISAFFLNFIPAIGSSITLILPTLMSLLQFESPTYALLVFILLSLVQLSYFNLLEPLVLGKRLNLNPIIILLAVLIWGHIWGIVGMFLAVPLTAIAKIIISNFEGQNIRFISDLMDNTT